MSLPAKVEKHIVRTDECWVWQDNLDVEGYGRMYVKGKYPKAHRLVYELLVGPIPNNLPLDHLCRNRACVNPKHLEPVENRINILRGVGVAAVNAKKTHCAAGHELSGSNLYMYPNGRKRACRLCGTKEYRSIRGAPR
jgi:hypothetical protein